MDLDSDGNNEVISGSYWPGHIFIFKSNANGEYAKGVELTDSSGEKLHGGKKWKNEQEPDMDSLAAAPWMVDWDADGDLDMLSGSAQGGVFLVTNIGTKTAPKFAEPVELLEPAGYPDHEKVVMGDAHLQGPQAGTRVWADDLNGDGKLDLLVGDNVHLLYPAEGIDEATARKEYEAWTARRNAFFQVDRDFSDEAVMEAYQKDYEKLQAELKEFVDEQYTGFVWVLYQK